MSAIIEVDSLIKKFANVEAVSGIGFAVQPGEIFGFLGPNGAGKTTTIKIIATLLRATAGKAAVSGFDVERQPHQVRQRIGLVFQDPCIDERLTAEENLWFHSVLYDVPRALFRKNMERVLNLVELSDRRDSLVRTFSGGMKRRLEIARGLLHRPDVLFLDEPTLGLDPQTRNAIWRHIRQLREESGLTVFMTTHYLDEAENCDRIAIIDRGKLQTVDSPAGLKRTIGGDWISVGGDGCLAADIAAAYQVEVRHLNGEIHFRMQSGAEFVPRLIADFGRRVRSISVKQPSLEDIFLNLTGHAIRQEEASHLDSMRRGRQLWSGAKR